jgi:hypothetical protein
MPYSGNDFGRRVMAVVPLALCIALASFATATLAAGPREGSAPKRSAPKTTEAKRPRQQTLAGTDARSTISATGRLMLVVVDQDGRPLARALVDVISAGTTGSYRERAITDGLGRISFSSVPEMVNLTVIADNPAYSGTFSQNIGVSQVGSSEVRVTVQTFAIPQPEPEPVQPTDPTTPGRRR